MKVIKLWAAITELLQILHQHRFMTTLGILALSVHCDNWVNHPNIFSFCSLSSWEPYVCYHTPMPPQCTKVWTTFTNTPWVPQKSLQRLPSCSLWCLLRRDRLGTGRRTQRKNFSQSSIVAHTLIDYMWSQSQIQYMHTGWQIPKPNVAEAWTQKKTLIFSRPESNSNVSIKIAAMCLTDSIELVLDALQCTVTQLDLQKIAQKAKQGDWKWGSKRYSVFDWYQFGWNFQDTSSCVSSLLEGCAGIYGA